MPTSLNDQLIEGCQLGQRFMPAEPRRAPHGPSGSHLGRNPGESLEFVDFRDYQPGDDLRRLDWNAYARSDSLVVRVFREEIAPHLDIVLDCSASMAVREPKRDGAMMLTGVLAGAADAAHYGRRCWRIDDRTVEVEASSRPVEQWQMTEPNGTEDSGAVLVASPPRFQPHGVRVLVSDLLFATDPDVVTAVLSRGAAVSAVVQLLDRDDRSPSQDASLRLVDSETGEIRELLVDEGVRRRYQHRLETHTRSWQLACERRGVLFASMTAEDVLDGKVDPLLRGGILSCR